MRLSSLASLAAAALIAAIPSGASASTFSNPTPITVPAGGASGPGTPYPSTIGVDGVPGRVVNARATLTAVSQPFIAQHIQALLVAPGGQVTTLLSGCGSPSPMSAETFTFDDAAPGPPPMSPDPCVGGTYKPTPRNFGEFEPPAPPGVHHGAMSALNLSPANGIWRLFANDYVGGDTRLGSIAGGWSLDLLTDATCSGRQATLTGTAGDDQLVGTEGDDVILGFSGQDQISGLGGRDVICGGDNKDILRGGLGKDKLVGQADPDKLVGNSGKDKLLGKGGKDKLNGGTGKDVCKGGKKDDTAKKCEVEKSI